jgi:hypothetical protein
LGAISCGGRQLEKRKRKKEKKEFPSSFLVESGRLLLLLPPSPPSPLLGWDKGVSKWVFDISFWLAILVFSPSFPYRWE